jgi:hypothetical protein
VEIARHISGVAVRSADKKEETVIKKHFTMAEQMAVSVFVKFSELVDSGSFTLTKYSNFTYFGEMVTTSIVKDEERLLKKRNIVFIRKHPEHCPSLVVKMVLSANIHLGRQIIDKYSHFWCVEKVVIGRLAGRNIVEIEEFPWTPPHLEIGLMEKKRRKIIIPIEEFISSNA